MILSPFLVEVELIISSRQLYIHNRTARTVKRYDFKDSDFGGGNVETHSTLAITPSLFFPGQNED
jgi:hypothetical protein